MRLVGHVTRRGKWRGVNRFCGGETTGGDPGVDKGIILKWIFRKWDVVVWTASSWLRIGTGGRHL
jgi:hypothetical protein